MTMKVLIVFGTRPEVIKLAPLIRALKQDPDCQGITCATTQHRELQNDILSLFRITPDYDLDIMQEGQDLFHITAAILHKIKGVLIAEKPDYVIVHGDTSTAFTAALAAFYQKIPVVHIEAGLRTGKLHSPFPEEANRSLISRIATLHMAPTHQAVQNLHQEGLVHNVHLVGNTIVDAVHWTLQNCPPENQYVAECLRSGKRNVLITVHRRENFGDPLSQICSAIQKICRDYPDINFIWPVHPNPNIHAIVQGSLQNIYNLSLITPLCYSDLLWIIQSSSLILSDSGGIQEEACILGKAIIVLREETERPEVIENGFGVLVGSDPYKIYSEFTKRIDSQQTLSSQVYGKPGVVNAIIDQMKKNKGVY